MTKITKSSGNVFADLNITQADDYLVKANLAIEIERLIKKRDLVQKDAAKIMGATQSDVSKLKNGHLDGFTLERLIGFLLRLGDDVRLVIKSAPRNRQYRGRFYTQIGKGAANLVAQV